MLKEVHILLRAGEPEMVFADFTELVKVCNEKNKEEDPELGDYWSTYSGVDFGEQDYRQVYKCHVCKEFRTWCDGGTDSECCDKCWAEAQRPWWLKLLAPFLPPGRHGCGECA